MYNQEKEIKANQRFRSQEEEDISSYLGSQEFQQIDQMGSFMCPICLCGQLDSEVYQWGDCHHQFCIDCLQAHIHAAVARLALPTCPLQQCHQKLNESTEIYKSLPAVLKVKVQKVISYKKILANPNFKPCQSSECTGAFDSSKKLECPVCQTKHCKQCFSKAHEGQCQNRVALQLQMTKKYRQCGQCGQVIEKIEGCTHMTCTCGNYFCYSCGQTLSGDHECQAPQDLNCMQSQRWQIEHLQFWYQNATVTLLKILLFFSPPTSFTKLPKALWIICFALSVYPFLTVLGVVLGFAAIGILLALGLILTLIVPFTELCGGNLMLFPNHCLAQNCGCCIAFLVVICLYPLIYVVNLVQLLYQIIQRQGVNILIPVIEILQGLKLIFLFPCLMMVDNQQFYLSTANLREPQPKMLINLSDQLR